MIVAQRRNKIKELLLQERSVKVADLVREFDVSEETVRRDLNYLEREGLIQKNYGGAILVEELPNNVVPIAPVHQRKSEYFEEKDAIGGKAAELIGEGQIVIIDSGSTTWCISRHLKHLQRLTVVTNGVDVADELSHSDGAEVLVLGGKLIKKSMSLVGPQAELELQNYNADYVFLGVSGISLRKGFTSTDIYEAEIKKAMIAAGQKIVVVADHSKFQRQSLISYSGFQDVDILITSDLADEAIVKEIEKMGVHIIRASCRRNSADEHLG